MHSHSNHPSIVAAFDFDGTLTYRDTLLPFLSYIHGGCLKACKQLLASTPAMLGFILGRVPRQVVKENILKNTLGGMPIEYLREKGADFAAGILSKHLRPEAMKRFQWHLSQGHRCILISASIDIYLIPWAKKAGFNDVLTSVMEVDPQGMATGKLAGLNCWGEEKLRRLHELLGERGQYILYAYGDSRGDQKLLESADYAYYRTFGGINNQT